MRLGMWYVPDGKPEDLVGGGVGVDTPVVDSNTEE